jgi:hypothetical protein
VTLLAKSVLMWLALAVAMFANGTFRVLVLQPRLGEDLARQLAVLPGIAIIFGLTLPFVRSLPNPTRADLLKVGALWLALTVAFETGLGLGRGMSWDAILADYNVARGRLWPLALLATFIAPWFWGTLVRGERPKGTR